MKIGKASYTSEFVDIEAEEEEEMQLGSTDGRYIKKNLETGRNKYDETAVRRVQYIIASVVYVDNGLCFEAFFFFLNKCNSMLLKMNRSNGEKSKNSIERNRFQ